jgi:hypothetical protein
LKSNTVPSISYNVNKGDERTYLTVPSTSMLVKERDNGQGAEMGYLSFVSGSGDILLVGFDSSQFSRSKATLVLRLRVGVKRKDASAWSYQGDQRTSAMTTALLVVKPRRRVRRCVARL